MTNSLVPKRFTPIFCQNSLLYHCAFLFFHPSLTFALFLSSPSLKAYRLCSNVALKYSLLICHKDGLMLRCEAALCRAVWAHSRTENLLIAHH